MFLGDGISGTLFWVGFNGRIDTVILERFRLAGFCGL